jgi:hypothetical protein
MQIPMPGPWEFHEPLQFRLAGFGGAAVFLRSQVVPGARLGGDGVRTAYDVMLLAPSYHVWYLTRPANDHVIDWLSSFFFAAASEFTPEQTVVPFDDPELGLSIRVVSSTDDRVELDVSVQRPDEEPDLLSFETSRYALAAAADAVRSLDQSWDTAVDDEEFPS